MISRRSILGTLAAGIAAPLRRTWADLTADVKPLKLPTLAEEPLPDRILEVFCTPYVDRMLSDREFRRQFVRQTDRVWGKKMRQLAYLLAVDEHPEIPRRRIINRALRRHLGL